MRILIVSSYAFGYLEYVVDYLKQEGHNVEIFYHSKPPLLFKYKNFVHHAACFLKKIAGNHPKKNHRYVMLKKALKGKTFDKTLVIHPQYLNNKTHQFLKKISKNYIVNLFDSLAKMPRQKPMLHHFDSIFSYEPIDCKKYGYQFITNYIPFSKEFNQETSIDFFNISSHDHRYDDLKKLTTYFNKKQYSYEFILYSKKIESAPNFDVITKKIDFVEILGKIGAARVMIDIQRKEQEGLSFRIFESLGFKKKLITTNKDVVNYDFYNPNNIHIVDTSNPNIPKDFLTTPYQEVPKEIYNKYTVATWANTIFNTHATRTQ